MTDDDFVALVEDVATGRPHPAGFSFGHREHLRLAWIRVRRDGPARGGDAVAETLRRLAGAHGEPERYHETLTRFWVALVAHVADDARGSGFDEAVATHPELLDRALVARHYSREALWSERARRELVSPDLRPLPAGP